MIPRALRGVQRARGLYLNGCERKCLQDCECQTLNERHEEGHKELNGTIRTGNEGIDTCILGYQDEITGAILQGSLSACVYQRSYERNEKEHEELSEAMAHILKHFCFTSSVSKVFI